MSLSCRPCAIVFLVCLSLISCEKVVNVNITDSPPQLVVDGFIETGKPPIVILTNTIGYFSKIDLSTFENTFAHNARISVRNGVREVLLREYTIDTAGNAKFYVYTLDTADQSALTFLGKVNETYDLTILYEGKTYTSAVRIPDCKPLDSMTALFPDRRTDTASQARILNVYFSDPDTPGNCVRYFTKRNSEPFYTAATSVFDDGLFNGAQNARIPLFLGHDHSRKTNVSTGYLFPGDTVTIKWCAIERPVFHFYNTLAYALSSVGNPFSTPINVRTNMNNGAIGIWAGYGSTEMTYIVPR